MLPPSWRSHKSICCIHLNWTTLKRTKQLLSVSRCILVFGVWAGNSLVPTNTFECIEATPTNFTAHKNLQTPTCMFPRENRPNSTPKSGETKNRRKYSLTMCLFVSPNIGEVSQRKKKTKTCETCESRNLFLGFTLYFAKLGLLLISQSTQVPCKLMYEIHVWCCIKHLEMKTNSIRFTLLWCVHILQAFCRLLVVLRTVSLRIGLNGRLWPTNILCSDLVMRLSRNLWW